MKTINLFVDIITKCQLRCSYCTSHDHKEWNRVANLDNIKKIATYISFYKYDINIVLFGGEPVLHDDILVIIETFRKIKNVKDIIVLSHGLSKYDYTKLNTKMCFTLHNHINNKQFETFVSNLSTINLNNMVLHLILPKDNIDLFMNRYSLLINKFPDINIEFSMIYNFNTYFDEIYFDKFNIEHILFEQYKQLILKHINIVPKEDIKKCYIKELNININGDITSDCLNIRDNIFKNPLFFRNYSNEFSKCTKARCYDCTGTITTIKEYK